MLRNIIYITALLMLTTGCTRPATYRSSTGAAWGTTYHITYKADRDLGDSIVAEMRLVEQSLSMFDKSSAVSRINRGECDSLDRMLADVLRLSLLVNKASGGMFDPTVAPLTDLWGFGRKGRTTDAPTAESIDSVLTRVGISKCMIKGNRLIKGHERMEFDFSAVAKGYGVDCVADMLRRNGVNDYMVEIGGEVSVSGKNRHGTDWRIQVDAPSDDATAHEALTVLELSDCAIASSGNYRNFIVNEDGTRTGHTINPLTGYPAVTRSLATTVIAPQCGLADALATALMACDPDSAAIIIGQFPSTSAIVMTNDSIYRINM